jgi:mxaJ protein
MQMIRYDRGDNHMGGFLLTGWKTRYQAKGLLAGLVLLLAAFVQAQEWEMRVCADPNNLPFSDREEQGFENRLAEIIAEELHAELTYVWWPQHFNPTVIQDQLREGHCDLIMGVGEGFEGLLTTLAYYRSTYVFVYRADSPFEINSLDDPVLHELRLGVERLGVPPHSALVNRGLHDNVVLQYAFGPYGEPDPLAPIVEAVAKDEVDVALAWGPVGGYYAKRQPVELKVVPVMPEIEPPFYSMVYAFTIGVRRGDEALRDRLNMVLATRWDEIQDVLQEYGVPLKPLPRPRVEIGG